MIGCYRLLQDSNKMLVLAGSDGKYTSGNTTTNKDACIKRCTIQGYSLAGIQFGYHCYCGERTINDLKRYQIDEKVCNKKKSQRCSNILSNTCNEDPSMVVFHTGIVLIDDEPYHLQEKGKNGVLL